MARTLGTAGQSALTCVFINKAFFCPFCDLGVYIKFWVAAWPGEIKDKRLKEWGMEGVRSAPVTLKLKGEIRAGHF